MNPLHQQTRRHFFERCGIGLGSIALSEMLASESEAAIPTGDPMAPRRSHHAAKAKNVIFLFMAGGPSQLELFEDKPRLR